MMTKTSEDQQKTKTGKVKGWLNRRTFIGSLVALFSALNVWVFGKRSGWWRERLMVDLKGPFASGTKIMIHEDKPGFVRASCAVIRNGQHESTLNVFFDFEGEQSKQRKIFLEYAIIDKNGGTISQGEKVYEDQSLIDGERFIQDGARPVVSSLENCAVVSIPKSMAEDIGRIRLNFTEAS